MPQVKTGRSAVFDFSIGEMRDRIEIQSPAFTSDGYGGKSKSWQSVVTTWAKVVALSPYERNITAQLQQEHDHRVIMRFRTDVKRKDRVVYYDDPQVRHFEVETVQQPDNRRRWTVIKCREITA